MFAKQIAIEIAYGCVGGFLAIIFMIENVARTAMQAESAEPFYHPSNPWYCIYMRRGKEKRQVTKKHKTKYRVCD